jgi:hypothetical protein
VLYDQEDEDVQHILTTFVFAWQFWVEVLTPINLQGLALGRYERNFTESWRKTARRSGKDKRKGLDSLIILGE